MSNRVVALVTRGNTSWGSNIKSPEYHFLFQQTASVDQEPFKLKRNFKKVRLNLTSTGWHLPCLWEGWLELMY